MLWVSFFSFCLLERSCTTNGKLPCSGQWSQLCEEFFHNINRRLSQVCFLFHLCSIMMCQFSCFIAVKMVTKLSDSKILILKKKKIQKEMNFQNVYVQSLTGVFQGKLAIIIGWLRMRHVIVQIDTEKPSVILYWAITTENGWWNFV